MRSRVRVALSLLAVVVVLAPSASTAAAAPIDDASSRPYLALGDSITAGWNASPMNCVGTFEGTAACKGFAGVLFSRYSASDGVTHMKNYGSPGASSGALAGQAGDAVARIDAASDTRAVTVGLGGNDLLARGVCENSWDEPECLVRDRLTDGLQLIEDALVAEDAAAETVALMAYWNPEIGLDEEGYYRRQLLGTNGAIGLADEGANVGLNDVIHQVASVVGVSVADPYSEFEACGQGFISGDGLHPNTAGHVALASVFPGGPATPACPSSEGPGGQTPAGIATLGAESAKLKKNKFSIEIACAAGGSACSGVAEVETAKPVSLSAAVTAKKKIVELSSTSFSIPAAATQPVQMKLSKKGKKLFKSKRKVKANVTVRTQGSSTVETTTSALTIKRKK